jgi:hypothetical protein
MQLRQEQQLVRAQQLVRPESQWGQESQRGQECEQLGLVWVPLAQLVPRVQVG